MTNHRKLTEVMQTAIAMAHTSGHVLKRLPGGYWVADHPGWTPHDPCFGTSTIEALVKRGFAEYVEWREGKRGNFPIAVKVKKVKPMISKDLFS